jgi:transposase-like protein
MHTIEVTRKFAEENACVDYLEQMRWPNEDSMFCRKCGLVGKSNFRSFTTKQTVRKKSNTPVRSRRLYECKGCKRQFSVKNDTVFGWTHLPLDKWFAAVALMLEAKKGMSAMQMCRHLGIDPDKNYKTVWYLCHRIREAMIEAGLLTGVVETDTTWMTPRKPRKGRPQPKNPNRSAVLGMIERGGKLRLIPVADEKFVILAPVMRDNIDKEALLQTDKAVVFEKIGHYLDFRGHRMINHIISYGEGLNHTNTIENAFSLLKRGIYGSYHKVSIKHLARYCNEFSFRFNRRAEQKQMFDATLRGLLKAKPLPYKKLTAAAELSEPSIPSDPAF